MNQIKTGEAETITSHYLFAQGSYRALYIANWIYRYHYENHLDLIAIFAGVVQESGEFYLTNVYSTFSELFEITVNTDQSLLRLLLFVHHQSHEGPEDFAPSLNHISTQKSLIYPYLSKTPFILDPEKHKPLSKLTTTT